MQFFADEPKYYVVLFFPLTVFLLGNNLIIHSIVLSAFCLLFAAGMNLWSLGTYFKNYYNMVFMLALFPILMFQNICCVAETI